MGARVSLLKIARSSGGIIKYYESEETFTRMVRPVIELGMSEIGLYYPSSAQQKPMFERIARNVLPLLKSRHATSC